MKTPVACLVVLLVASLGIAQQYNVPFKHAAAVGGGCTLGNEGDYHWTTDNGGITESSGAISSWVDDVASYDIAISNGSQKPTLETAFLTGSDGALDGVTSDGGDCLKGGNFSGGALTQPFTVSMIVEYTDTGNRADHTGKLWFSGNDWTNNATHFNRYSSSKILSSINAGSTLENGSYDWDVGNPHYVVIEFDGANSFIRVDGSEIQSGNTGTNVHDGFELFMYPSCDGSSVEGTVVEIIIEDAAYSGGDLTDLETYLACRSGL